MAEEKLKKPIFFTIFFVLSQAGCHTQRLLCRRVAVVLGGGEYPGGGEHGGEAKVVHVVEVDVHGERRGAVFFYIKME